MFVLHFIDRGLENRVITSQPPVCDPILEEFPCHGMSHRIKMSRNYPTNTIGMSHGIIRQIGAAEKTIGMSHGSFGVTLCKNVKEFFGKQEVNDVKQN